MSNVGGEWGFRRAEARCQKFFLAAALTLSVPAEKLYARDIRSSNHTDPHQHQKMSGDQATKKRKRKHGGGTKEARDPPVSAAIAPPVEKKDKVRRHKQKKARKEDTPPPPSPESEVEDEDENEGIEDGEEGRFGDEDEEIKGIIEAQDENDAVEDSDSDAGRPRHPDADIESSVPSDIPLNANLTLPDTGEHPVLFADLKLSPGTQKAIEKMGFEKMTEVQSRTIPPLMAGRDVCLYAKLNCSLGAIC